MKKEEVPQDKALLGKFHEVAYAVDADGKYVQEKSAGWDPKTVANSQFWKSVQEDVEIVVGKIRNNELSPIAYFMTISQMDIALLSSYTGMIRWRVRRHMKPKVFAKLKPAVLQRYAMVFKISIDQLKTLPPDADRPESICRWADLRD